MTPCLHAGVTYWHVRIITYCMLYLMYAYLSRIAHYANLEKHTHHMVCKNKQNKPLRQHTKAAETPFRPKTYNFEQNEHSKIL